MEKKLQKKTGPQGPAFFYIKSLSLTIDKQYQA